MKHEYKWIIWFKALPFHGHLIEKDLQKDTTERTGWIKSKNSLEVKAEPRSNTT
jgi:hypothetical protein